MKKIIGIAIVFLLVPFLAGVYAQQQQPGMNETGKQEVTRAEIQEAMMEKQRAMEQEMQGMTESERRIYEGQNSVALAVHALLASGDIERGIGSQISEIAREFNNSIQATIKAEETMENRNALARTFAGGDHRSARSLMQETKANMERIEQLRQILEGCEECGQEVRTLLLEQVRNIELEQERLNQRAVEELSKRGLLGWIWKR
jgi:hypothetical protein